MIGTESFRTHPFSLAFREGSGFPIPPIESQKPIPPEVQWLLNLYMMATADPVRRGMLEFVFLSAPVYKDLNGPEDESNLYPGREEIAEIVNSIGFIPGSGVDLVLHNKSTIAGASKTHAVLAGCPIVVVDASERVGVGTIDEARVAVQSGAIVGWLVGDDAYEDAQAFLTDRSRRPSGNLPPYLGWGGIRARNLINGLKELPRWLVGQREILSNTPEILEGRVLEEAVNAMRMYYMQWLAASDDRFIEWVQRGVTKLVDQQGGILVGK